MSEHTIVYVIPKNLTASKIKHYFNNIKLYYEGNLFHHQQQIKFKQSIKISVEYAKIKLEKKT